MTSKPLLIFDFDGVIVDGMYEYWSSARKACLALLKSRSDSNILPKEIPSNFRELRPWINQGWEMVLLAAEMTRTESPLNHYIPSIYASEYHLRCQEALQIWKWTDKKLQNALDNIRTAELTHNHKQWIQLHKPFLHIFPLLNSIHTKGIEWAVLTTKGESFTYEILNSLGLQANLVYGHESGSKIKILKQLKANRSIQGFIEDRRATLELVRSTPETSDIPCYLASWGYLKPNDIDNLPKEIHLLKPENLMAPLARAI